MHQYSSSSLFTSSYSSSSYSSSSYSSLFNSGFFILVLYFLAPSTSMEKIRNKFDIIKGLKKIFSTFSYTTYL